MEQTVGRFAPSPSGRMHLGNVFCALMAWLFCRQAGGRLILRIEDLDTARCKPAYTAQLVEDLNWLGLTWDEGGSLPGYRQSERSDYYSACLKKLQQQGVIYPCFCSRGELHAASAPHRSDGTFIYTGRCRNLTAQQRQVLFKQRQPAWRLAVPNKTICFCDQLQGEVSQDLAADCGDFILRRSDGVFAYQLAVVADDAAMGVTQVVRGKDLLASTPRQLLLYQLLGVKPPQFYHLPLLCSESGARLSKRDQSLDLGALRRQGITAQEILGRLAWLCGLQETFVPQTAQQLLANFNPQKLKREDIIVPADLFCAEKP